jgi:hypothetical protein
MRIERATSPELCFACGEPAAAVWVGHQNTAACERCAVEILPALIADAVRTGGPGTNGYQGALTAVTAAFWKGVANRLAAEKRQAQSHATSRVGPN